MMTQGRSFSDERGNLFYNNDLDLSEIKRMYIIENKDRSIIRAWQAHKIEKRWFIVATGKFEIKLVKIDDFDNPSDDLDVEIYELNSDNMDCLQVDPGFATSIQALSDDSKLIVFSNYKLGEVDDNYKFNPQKWSKK